MMMMIIVIYLPRTHTKRRDNVQKQIAYGRSEGWSTAPTVALEKEKKHKKNKRQTYNPSTQQAM